MKIVKSLDLMKKICENKCIAYLHSVVKHQDHNAMYVFIDNPKINKIIEQYGIENIDYITRDFNYTLFNNFDNGKTIITRNCRIVDAIFEAGYAGNLCETFQDLSGRRAFRFISNPVIKEIKARIDKSSEQLHYEKIGG